MTLSRLQRAKAGAERDAAWAEFIAIHSHVVLHTCRSVVHDHDTAMDGYAFALEALREDNHRRLRAYVPDGKTKFTSWLLVVTRRLVMDYLRHRYGRSRSAAEDRRADDVVRRNLEDLLADDIEPDQLPDRLRDVPDAALQRTQLTGALRAALTELTPEDRLLLVLRFVDERSVRDIATTLRLPSVFHVYRRLSSVLTTVRELLRRRGVEEAEP